MFFFENMTYTLQTKNQPFRFYCATLYIRRFTLINTPGYSRRESLGKMIFQETIVAADVSQVLPLAYIAKHCTDIAQC